jgi:hypothetical protein
MQFRDLSSKLQEYFRAAFGDNGCEGTWGIADRRIIGQRISVIE